LGIIHTQIFPTCTVCTDFYANIFAFVGLVRLEELEELEKSQLSEKTKGINI